MRLFDDEGNELDAEFEVQRRQSGASVVLHARGGSAPGSRTNRDYFAVLEEILKRMGRARAKIRSIQVDSQIARKLPVGQRLVDLEYPIELSPLICARDLRVQITEGQRTVASTVPPGRPGGNKHKRIRIEFDFDAERHDIDDLLEQRTYEAAESTEGVTLREYTPDVVDRTIKPTAAFFRDDSKLERSLAAHAITQNALAEFVRSHGMVPRRRMPGEPDFDVAWLEGNQLVVAEVKSFTGANRVSQLRVGIGQVLHYRELIQSQGSRVVRAVLAVERDPGPIWGEVCDRAAITLTWPPDWRGLLCGRLPE